MTASRRSVDEDIEVVVESQEGSDVIRFYPDSGLVTIYGDITDGAGRAFLDLALHEQKNVRFVAIDTAGGNATTSLLMGEVLAGLKIPVIGLGKVYSAGAYLYSFGTKRYCLPTTGFLIHSGAVTLGTSPYNDLKEFWPYWERLSEGYMDTILSKTRLTTAQRKKLAETILSGKEYYFPSQESKDIGFTHEIITFDKFMKLLSGK